MKFGSYKHNVSAMFCGTSELFEVGAKIISNKAVAYSDTTIQCFNHQYGARYIYEIDDRNREIKCRHDMTFRAHVKSTGEYFEKEVVLYRVVYKMPITEDDIQDILPNIKSAVFYTSTSGNFEVFDLIYHANVADPIAWPIDYPDGIFLGVVLDQNIAGALKIFEWFRIANKSNCES